MEPLKQRACKKYIVVGGYCYADIDVLACISAYCELLTLKGYHAEGIITGPWNQTIPQSIKKWPITIQNTFRNTPAECLFIVVDVSNPNFIEKFVILENVAEIYDHHFGYEEFWQKRLHGSAHIEPVGACATLIWEQFKKNNVENSISTLNANLLYTAIFSNTLHFKAQITSQRDITAGEELAHYIDLPTDWQSTYYHEIAQGFTSDFVNQVQKDTKLVTFKETTFSFGQIELWNAIPFTDILMNKITANNFSGDWLINMISISEGRSYLYTNMEWLKTKLRETIDLDVNNNFLITKKLWLRKELLKEFSFF